MPDCTYSILGEGPYDGYYCTKHYTGNGGTTVYTVPFPYIGQEDWDGETSAYIRAWLNGIETTQFTMPTSASIEFVSAPGNNVCIKIRRDSNLADRKVNFQSGSRHTAGVENLDSKNAFYLIQELADQLYDASLSLTPSENNFNAYRWTANGVTTNFEMSETYGPVDQTGISNDAEVLVMLNGAIQQTDAYTLVDIAGITNVVIAPAPPSGFAVEARTMTSGTPQSVQIPEGSVEGAMLADCAIDADVWTRVVCIDDLGDVGDVMIWDDGTGGPELTIRALTHEDISDFDTGVRQNRLDQMAAPTTNVSMNSRKITNLLDGAAGTDAANVGQVEALIAAAVPVGTIPQILSGSITFNSTSYQQVDLNFDYDTLIMVVPLEVAYTGGNGGGYTYDDSRTYVQLASDGAGEIEYVYDQGVFFNFNLHAFKIQQISEGFQYKRTGQSGNNITIRYTAIKYT